jgi:hypothetical protein
LSVDISEAAPTMRVGAAAGDISVGMDGYVILDPDAAIAIPI